MHTLLAWGILFLTSTVPGSAATTTESARAEIEATGGLASPYVRNGGSVSFWVRVANRSSQPVTGIHLGPLDAPTAYSVVSCWSGEPAPKSSPGAGGSCPTSPVNLQPGQEATLGGTIHSSDLAEQQTVGALVEWNTPAGPSSREVTLGSLSSDSSFTYALETHTVLVSFFGVAVLGLVGYSLKYWFEKRGHRAEIERARQAETWTQLLKEASEFSLNDYLPTEGALEGFLSNAQRHRESSASVNDEAEEVTATNFSARLAFYFWALFERRMLELYRRMGGVHFKDHTGEVIVTDCYARYKSLFYGSSERDRRILDDMLHIMPLKVTAPRFLRRLDGWEGVPPDSRISAAWNMFHRWLHKDRAGDAIRCLGAMQPVFDYELNRPYKYWYGYLDPIDLSEEQVRELKSLAGAPETSAHARAWCIEMDAYLKRSKPSKRTLGRIFGFGSAPD